MSGSSFRYYAPNNGKYNLVGISGRYTAYTLLACTAPWPATARR